MDSQPTDAPDTTERTPTIFILVAIYLIGSFVWRVLVPAHEYPMRTEQVLTMLLDLGLLVGLFGLKSRAPSMQMLFWIGLMAGVGLFAIRLNSDASWWTGHLIYKL